MSTSAPETEETAAWATRIAEACGGLVSHLASEGKAVAGGVVFDLPAASRGNRVVRAMVATARALEGQTRAGDGGKGEAIVRLFGRGGERRYQRALEEMGIGAPLQPSHGSVQDPPGKLAVCAGFDEQGMTVEWPDQVWVTSYLPSERGWKSKPYARVPKEALPLDLAVFTAMVRAIAEAAPAYDPGQPYRACKKCGERFPIVDMPRLGLCEGCAEIDGGIVR